MDTTVIKGMLQSKTMWFSAATTALGVYGWVADHSAIILALAPQVAPILTIFGVIAGVLRVLTESSADWKAPVVDAKAPSAILTATDPG